MYQRLVPLSISNIHIDDAFWNRYTKLVSEVVLPYQWGILNDRVPDAPPSHAIHNMRIAAGEEKGEREGPVFQDSDVYKWLEAVAYSLAVQPDEELEQKADSVISLIDKIQCEDGYLNTYYTLVEPNSRWCNLVGGHELYCAGHLAEAAVAYYQSTQKRKLLDITCRFIDLILKTFGPGEDQIHGYPGHPELELALVRLYDVTGKAAYLDLAKYFVDIRGESPNYFLQEFQRPNPPQCTDLEGYDPAYAQAHVPVRNQNTAEGHAVRAVYLYCAMADLALLYNDQELLNQCKILWENMVNKRMYLTGSIGSSGFLERITTDFDLPNDCNYSETCASIGLALFGLRMSRIMRDESYLEIVERALYNTVRGGISLTGDRYFYVNPLEVWPDICMEHTSRAHVKAVRQKWFDVACCPTNMARTFTSLGQYIYSANDNELFVNLFVQNSTQLTLDGKDVSIDMHTNYPRSGNIDLSVKAQKAQFALYIRIPTFAQEPLITVNGEAILLNMQNGFRRLERTWENDEINVSFSLKPVLVYANPLVRANVGKVAIMRGPEVYCFEEVDNGSDLAALYLSENCELTEQWDETLFGGTMVVYCEGFKLMPLETDKSSDIKKTYEKQPMKLKAIPYGSWNNRQDGEMIVWVHSVV